MSKDKFIPQAVAQAAEYDKNAQASWLSDYRCQQRESLSEQVFPHRQVEFFKYNKFDCFENQLFPSIYQNGQADTALANNPDINTIFSDNALSVVFLDGVYQPALSQLNNQIIELTSFADANKQQQHKIMDMLTSDNISHNPFTMLNAAYTDNGILLEVTDAAKQENTKVTLEVVYLTTPAVAQKSLSTQLLVDIAENCQLVLTERAVSLDGNSLDENSADSNSSDTASMLSTARTLFNLADSAQLTHYHLQLKNALGIHFGSVVYQLHEHARINAFYAGTGSELKKIDVTANHLGEHTYAGINGVYVATNEQQIDYHTIINHAVPHGTTNENFRGVINGQAEGVFNGRIHIFEGAQKTLAEMSNKNLLISDNAVIHAKPELEIYADDVICAHGATISQLDDASLYYLQARGIAREQAELMLSHSFIDELLAELPDEMADYLHPILTRFFDAPAQ